MRRGPHGHADRDDQDDCQDDRGERPEKFLAEVVGLCPAMKMAEALEARCVWLLSGPRELFDRLLLLLCEQRREGGRGIGVLGSAGLVVLLGALWLGAHAPSLLIDPNAPFPRAGILDMKWA